jgi:nucleolar GTP-binding protein
MFNKIKIETSKFYLEQAIKSMERYAGKKKDEIQLNYRVNVALIKKEYSFKKLNKQKDLELGKIDFFNVRINSYFTKIIDNFPKFRRLAPIYVDLINLQNTKIEKIEEYLIDIQQLKNRIDEISVNQSVKIKNAKTNQTICFIIKKYFGKVKKAVEGLEETFNELNKISSELNTLPTFEDCPTISIAGFPNVGKSTLMKKLTNSNVEIKNYPFTTKKLMFGYIKKQSLKQLQLIDTPGLLNRDNLNLIEKNAQLIIDKYSNLIVFVLDITESCGYKIKDQLKLFKEITKKEKETYFYFSKTDIFSKENETEFKKLKKEFKDFVIFNDFQLLKEDLLKKLIKEKIQIIK